MICLWMDSYCCCDLSTDSNSVCHTQGCFAEQIFPRLSSANFFGAIVALTSHFFSLQPGFTSQCQAEAIKQLSLGMTCKDKYNWVVRHSSV